ncbi:hypothetical protein Tco_0213396 [Tanacetum coccineum]
MNFYYHNSRPITNNNTTVDPHSNKASSNTTSNSPVSLSNEQLTRLMNLLNDNGVSTANADIFGHPVNPVLDALKDSLNLDSHSTSDHLCDTCNKAKQTREPFPLKYHKSKQNGELDQLRKLGTIQNYLTEQDVVRQRSPNKIEIAMTLHLITFKGFIEFNFETEELPANTLRRSSRQTKLPSSLNDFIVEGKVKYGVEKVKYGVEKVVNYANLNHDNYCVVSALNKSVEPTCYEEAILDSNWIDAMNAEI